ncbi:hypothetical protein ACHAQA_000103 [Verticillium albo-atrum]
MAAPYAPLASAASSPDADDDAKDFLSSQASTTNNSTNASPAPNLCLAGTAPYTPLSMSVDSSDLFSDLPTTKERRVSKTGADEQDTTDGAVRVAPGGNAPTQAYAPVMPTHDSASPALGADAQQQELKAAPAKESPVPRNADELDGSAQADHGQSETLSQGQGQHSREEDSAEITGFSRARGHAGSTPLSIPALLLGSKGGGRATHRSQPPGYTQSKNNSNTLDTTVASDLDRNLSSPSSPTSLIEQLQETLQASLQQQAASPSSSSPDSPPTVATASTTLRRPEPIVRTTSDSDKFTVRHPIPDLNTRSGAYTGNIATLEKTAERLSMTSSIEDAIRDLHGELKRSDSRRSSILAASNPAFASASSPEGASPPLDGSHPPVPPSLARHISSASNIVEVNNAARYGGYSPAGYVMSPNHSLTSRLRSASKTSNGRPDFDVDAFVSRNGPGKSSTRSARSSKMSLTEIAESEPTALTQDVLDKAERLPAHQEHDETNGPALKQSNNSSHDAPSTDAFHNMLDSGAVPRPSDDRHNGASSAQTTRQQDPMPEQDRPATPRSTSTYDVNNAFGDFDGVHCEPDFGYFEEVPMPDPEPMPEPQSEQPYRRPDMPRPQSYFDQDTGQQMMYYPARVPAMLNLPPKLSKKPKAAIRNARHSKVLQAMGHPGLGQPDYMERGSHAPPVRQSTLWLPDPVESEAFSPFPLEPSPDEPAHDRASLLEGDHERRPWSAGRENGPDSPYDSMPQPPPPARQRSPRTAAMESHKSAHIEDLPPHLRASAFFELPPESPNVEVKGGSAMDTLDSILNASANAPADAFTDHVFAGKLGREVYGREKKANRKSSALLQPEHADGKKRGSFMPFGKSSNDGSSDRRNTITGNSIRSGKVKEHGDDEESQALSGSVDGEHRRDDEEEFVSEDEEDLYAGPPTTLLAELQLRKHEQKQRTRNLHQAVPGGMHSTLLELDAVAEAQRKTRNTRRVNLAWEDPDANPDGSSDDEDVPLGLLFAGKAAGSHDFTSAMAELNRPIGLMERREMEDNEPLSARRARLQGNEPLTIAKRRSMMTLNPGGNNRLTRMPSPQRSASRLDLDASAPQIAEPEEPEVEGETLAERVRRLRTKEEAEHSNLPRARPVSAAFSVELLSQFGDLDEDKIKDKAGPAKKADEEEETLGQRRKRLQAEREAREREMNTQVRPAITTRRTMNMADVLGAHPVRDNIQQDSERRRLEGEQNRARIQDEKMAALRAQMPQTLPMANHGARTGGFRNGSYNDGLAGYGGYGASGMNGSRTNVAMNNYAPQPTQMGVYGGGMQGMGAPMQGAGYNQGYGGGMGMQMPQMMPQMGGMGMQQGMGGMPMNMNMNMNMGMNMKMPMAGQAPPSSSVERWRQSIMP